MHYIESAIQANEVRFSNNMSEPGEEARTGPIGRRSEVLE